MRDMYIKGKRERKREVTTACLWRQWRIDKNAWFNSDKHTSSWSMEDKYHRIHPGCLVFQTTARLTTIPLVFCLSSITFRSARETDRRSVRAQTRLWIYHAIWWTDEITVRVSADFDRKPLIGRSMRTIVVPNWQKCAVNLHRRRLDVNRLVFFPREHSFELIEKNNNATRISRW